MTEETSKNLPSTLFTVFKECDDDDGNGRRVARLLHMLRFLYSFQNIVRVVLMFIISLTIKTFPLQ